MDAGPQPYPTSRREAGVAMRSRLLDSAARILASEGLSGLTARRLSAEAGASTKVVYNHFGGMPAVIAALYSRGFSMLAKRLSHALEIAESDDKIGALARAYRDFAHRNPDLFDLMYGPSVTHLLPTPEMRIDASSALEILVKGLSESGAPNPGDEARALWAAIHGVVALERTGWFGDEEAQSRLCAVVANTKITS
jgi:AcrR family transcriptional regulator